MEVNDNLLHAAAAEPMRLGPAGESYAFGCEAIIFRELKIDGHGGSIHVPVLGQVEVAQLGTEHGEHDIFEVCVGTIGAFERRCDETAGR